MWRSPQGHKEMLFSVTERDVLSVCVIKRDAAYSHSSHGASVESKLNLLKTVEEYISGTKKLLT